MYEAFHLTKKSLRSSKQKNIQMKEAIQKKDKVITIITTIISIVVVIAMIIWGIKTFVFSEKYISTDDAQIGMYINPVVARVTGYVKEIHFDENQKVNKGDTLVVIDNSDYAVQQQQADASLDNARAQIDVLNVNAQTAEKDVLVSRSKTEAAKARLEDAQKEYDRYKQLFDEESATGQQLDNKLAALQVTKADYEAALQAESLAQSKVNAIRTEIKAAQSEAERRGAVVSAQNLTSSYTVITAPYDGQMGRRTLQTGQLVQPGQTLAFIVDLSSGKWVIANFKETQIANMKIGQSAKIEVDAFPKKKFTGTIESFSAATGSALSVMPPDNSTGNFVKTAQRIPVKIMLDSADADIARLSAGMNATVTVRK